LVTLTYSKRIDAFNNSADVTGINQVGTTINSNFEDESLSAMGRNERTLRKIKGSFRGNVSWSSTNNLIGGEQRTSDSFTQIYTTSLTTNFSNAPNLELGYRDMVNNYENGDLETT